MEMSKISYKYKTITCFNSFHKSTNYINIIKSKSYCTWKSSHLGKVWEQLRICAYRAAEMNRSTQGTLYYVLEQDKLQQTVSELDPAHTCSESVPTNIMTLLNMLDLRFSQEC
jgi:hypothetical protein